MPRNPQETMGRVACPPWRPWPIPMCPSRSKVLSAMSREKPWSRGTLYPGLDLPFMGMVNQNNLPVTPLSEVQVLAFAVQELALYLDTHPEDTEALELYRQYQQLYQKVSQAYEREKRPLNHAAPGRGDTYAWLDDPWPWEYAANKGE